MEPGSSSMRKHDETTALLPSVTVGSREGITQPHASVRKSFLSKMLVTVAISLLNCTTYFYDIPSTVQDILRKDLHLDSCQFMNLFAFYSWPNVVACFLGGVVIDRFLGIRLGGAILTCTVMISQVFFIVGMACNNLPLMYCSRMILGIGVESQEIVQTSYCVAFFPRNQRFFVYSLKMGIEGVVTALLINAVTPTFRLMQQHLAHFSPNVLVAITISVVSLPGLLSVISSFVLICLPKHSHLQNQSNPTGTGHNTTTVQYGSRRTSNALKFHVHRGGRPNPAGRTRLTMLSQFSSLFEMSRRFSQFSWRQCHHLSRLPGTLWPITLVCVTFYVTVFPFLDVGQLFFQRKYAMPVEKANLVSSLFYLLSALSSPLVGFLIGFVGFNLYWLVLAILLNLGCHLAFTFDAACLIHPSVLVSLQGLSYAIIVSLWPLVGEFCPPALLNTAYGIMMSALNVGLAIGPIVIARILDSRGFFAVQVFYLCNLYCCLASLVVLYWMNRRKSLGLNDCALRRPRRYAMHVDSDDEDQRLSMVSEESGSDFSEQETTPSDSSSLLSSTCSCSSSSSPSSSI